VVWEGTKLEALPYLSSEFRFAHANGINNRGDVVGANATIEGPSDALRVGIPVATLWHQGIPYSLNNLIDEDDPLKACVDLQLAQAINDGGQIAVEGVNRCENSGSTVFILSPVRRRY
jgi:uncharacterized membrane protein